MKNLSNMLKEAQKLQERMSEMQTRLADVEITGAAGGGMVIVTLDGKGQTRKIQIDPSLLVPGEVEMIEDLVVAAANDAKAKLDVHLQAEMSKVAGGLPLPPGLKLPF
jgi:DNA-binding YbaB/EbfC family protein